LDVLGFFAAADVSDAAAAAADRLSGLDCLASAAITAATIEAMLAEDI